MQHLVIFAFVYTSCTTSPDCSKQIESNLTIGNQTISPFYISLGNNRFLLNCTSEDANDLQLGYLMDNKLNLIAKRTVPFDSKYFLPSMYYNQELILAEHGYDQWKKAKVIDNELIQDTVSFSLESLVDIQDRDMEFLGIYRGNKIINKKDSLMSIELNNTVWSCPAGLIKNFCLTNNILVTKNNDSISFVNLDKGTYYQSIKYDNNIGIDIQRENIVFLQILASHV
jgi:hypothetical protein